MRKIFIFISLLLGILYNNSCHATSLELFNNSKPTTSIYIFNILHTACYKISDSTLPIVIEKVFTDNDNNEENDENSSISNKKLVYLKDFSLVKKQNSNIHFVSRKLSFTHYYLRNFSRIPRYNFITLSVFRI